MIRFTPYGEEDEPVTPEDKQWLDEQVLEARREFSAEVYQAHQDSRFARYS